MCYKDKYYKYKYKYNNLLLNIKGGSKYDTLDETSECTFCLETIWKNECVKLNCNHVFHTECLIKWVNPTCPICRTSIIIDKYIKATCKFDINTLPQHMYNIITSQEINQEINQEQQLQRLQQQHIQQRRQQIIQQLAQLEQQYIQQQQQNLAQLEQQIQQGQQNHQNLLKIQQELEQHNQRLAHPLQ